MSERGADIVIASAIAAIPCDPRALAWAQAVFDRVLAPLGLEWRRRGTCVEAWRGRRRIAFAAHKTYASFYFRETGPVASYHAWGGTCPTGKYTIRVPVGGDFEAALLTLVVSESLGLSPAGAAAPEIEPEPGGPADAQPARCRTQRPRGRGRPGRRLPAPPRRDRQGHRRPG